MVVPRDQEAESQADAARADAAYAGAEVDALRLRLDREIRTALETEISAETTSGCEQAKEQHSYPALLRVRICADMGGRRQSATQW